VTLHYSYPSSYSRKLREGISAKTVTMTDDSVYRL